MSDLRDGESVEIKGSGAKPYVVRNTAGAHPLEPTAAVSFYACPGN